MVGKRDISSDVQYRGELRGESVNLMKFWYNMVTEMRKQWLHRCHTGS